MDDGRTESVDVFRGITVVLMIIVNNPGSWSHIYRPLQHARWHGLLAADLVFPFFLFIMGVSIELSLKSRIARMEERSAIAVHIMKRTAVLFLLGLFLNGFPFYPAERILEIRVPGVLQRIAVVYCITAFLCLRTSVRLQAAVLAALLSGYWALCALVPVPGTGQPGIEPVANIAAWLDRLLFGGHLWKVTATWDPEGFLSTISAVGTCILGVWTGKSMTSGKSETAKTVYLVAAGLFFIAAGLVWGRFFPVNKSLWTGSYVLLTAGIAGLCLAVFRHLIDVRGTTWWTGPFRAMGLNSLAAFFLSSLAARLMNVIEISQGEKAVSLQVFLYEHLFTPHLGPYDASLAWALLTAAFWIAVMIVLYRKRILIRL
jgi:predicted acyltransferase